MSSIPGRTLEDLVAWCYDIIVEGQDDPNTSLQIAEMLGTSAGRRPVLTEAEFAPLLARFESHRESAEYLLGEFDEDCQSWRDYGGSVFGHVFTDENDAWALEYLKSIGKERK